MKHPGYSKAKNEYAQRTETSLSSSGKKALKAELKRFNDRLKKLIKE